MLQKNTPSNISREVGFLKSKSRINILMSFIRIVVFDRQCRLFVNYLEQA